VQLPGVCAGLLELQSLLQPDWSCWICTFGGLQEPGGQLQLFEGDTGLGEDLVLVTCRQRQGYVLQWAMIWGWRLVDWCLSRLHELDV